jgi:hypothetical protein
LDGQSSSEEPRFDITTSDCVTLRVTDLLAAPLENTDVLLGVGSGQLFLHEQ